MRLAVFQEPFNCLTDAGKSEISRIKVAKLYPLAVVGIIVSNRLCPLLWLAEVEHVKGVDVHARVVIDVWDGEQETARAHFKTCLLTYLTEYRLLVILIHIDKASRQVEGALGRLLGSTNHQQLVFAVTAVTHYERRRCGRWIGIIGEATVRTVLALDVVNRPSATATARAILEDL